MKNYLKTSKWLRWVAAGAFGFMLVFNIMVSLEFDKDKILPSITLIELGNKAMAQTIENPWPPDTGSLKCRCHGAVCSGGNYISFNRKCAEFSGGTGNCNSWSSNC
ncbi:hypothetical protein [Arthrospiribacter ruber]|uniref:Uncharacterized protein n=1 Tax=Arthrospiribacter ruber TaxID=2487934 RepID=A0A951IVA6_9BACT|nr:hypothetical protein [Arthrospiribacter ruber]MBW3466957.1 hypothetical protein [Arthrospiribacter ruber]